MPVVCTAECDIPSIEAQRNESLFRFDVVADDIIRR